MPMSSRVKIELIKNMENESESIQRHESSLLDENKDLRYEIEQQMEIIESQKQELYSAKRTIERLNSLKVEMDIEIEALTGLQHINGNLETKVRSLETELSTVKVKCINLEADLKEERGNHDEIVAKFSEDLETLKSRHDDTVTKQAHDELLNKILSLEEKNSYLMEANRNIQCVQQQNLELSDRLFAMELANGEKDKELFEMKSILDLKSNDLASALLLVEELQGEKAMMTAELENLKSAPANPMKRGNSLFAEVEDKRQSVISKYEALNNKYKELKKSFLRKNAELKLLEAENNDLRKQWKDEENAPYEETAKLIESYKVRIDDLTHTISYLEKRSSQIVSVTEVNNAHVECINSIIGQERKVINELRKEMEQRSIRELSQAQQLIDLNKQHRALKAQSMKKDAIITDLKMECERYKSMQKMNDTSLLNITNKIIEKDGSQSVLSKTVRFNEPMEETSVVPSSINDENQAFKKPAPVGISAKFRTVQSAKVSKKENKRPS